MKILLAAPLQPMTPHILNHSQIRSRVPFPRLTHPNIPHVSFLCPPLIFTVCHNLKPCSRIRPNLHRERS